MTVARTCRRRRIQMRLDKRYKLKDAVTSQMKAIRAAVKDKVKSTKGKK